MVAISLEIPMWVYPRYGFEKECTFFIAIILKIHNSFKLFNIYGYLPAPLSNSFTLSLTLVGPVTVAVTLIPDTGTTPFIMVA